MGAKTPLGVEAARVGDARILAQELEEVDGCDVVGLDGRLAADAGDPVEGLGLGRVLSPDDLPAADGIKAQGGSRKDDEPEAEENEEESSSEVQKFLMSSGSY